MRVVFCALLLSVPEALSPVPVFSVRDRERGRGVRGSEAAAAAAMAQQQQQSAWEAEKM